MNIENVCINNNKTNQNCKFVTVQSKQERIIYVNRKIIYSITITQFMVLDVVLPEEIS